MEAHLAESTETLCHGLSQGALKRGLRRSLLSDNSAAMLAAYLRASIGIDYVECPF